MKERPLLELFPGLKPALPWVPLADLPTSVEALPEVAKNLWIKRDDRSSPVYGGNKVRKLEFIIGRVKEKGYKSVVTFGATGTNHGVATSIYCKQHGLDCTVLLFDQPDSETVRQNLELMQKS